METQEVFIWDQRIAVPDVLIQAETQIVFLLVDKSNGVFMGKGEPLHQ